MKVPEEHEEWEKEQKTELKMAQFNNLRYVRFSNPNNGAVQDQRLANQHLVIGSVYRIGEEQPEDFVTWLYLVEKPWLKFNSVLFEEVKIEGKSEENQNET